MDILKPASSSAACAPSQSEQRHYVATTAGSDLTFGVLRRTYLGLVNSAVDFGWSKLHPIRPAGEPGPGESRCWQPTACRSTVLLPPGAPDMLWSPQALLEVFERQLAQGLGPHGFSAFCTLARDETHGAIEDAWRATA